MRRAGLGEVYLRQRGVTSRSCKDPAPPPSPPLPLARIGEVRGVEVGESKEPAGVKLR